MKIKFARLQNFRNVGFAEIGLDAASVWICGANAQGKTNILESLYISGTTKSHKGSRDKDMIRFDKEKIKAAGHPCTTMLIVTAEGSAANIQMHSGMDAKAGETTVISWD